MGRLRGKRNRDQDRYWTIQKRAEQAGMVGAVDASLCLHCLLPAPSMELHEGWCLTCISAWVDRTDPWLVLQAQHRLPPTVVPSTLMNEMKRLESRILQPIPDEAFLPLTQFMGHRGIGSQRAMWNFLQALYVFELDTPSDATKLGVFAPNTVHLCGRHAPVQRMSLTGYLSRMKSAGTDFKLLTADPLFRDYLRGFIADNHLERQLFTFKRTSVDVTGRWQLARSWAHYGKPHFDKHCPTVWPFARDDGDEAMPDIVMEIGELVPVQMPETLRQDLCQDLVVAVLSGEATLDNLRGNIQYYVREAFKYHPLKYGRYSFDQPDPAASRDGEDYRKQGDHLTRDELSLDRAELSWSNTAGWPRDPQSEVHGWHRGRDRPLGLTSMGEALREKHGGFAIKGGHVIAEESEMDPDIREVYEADQRPRWREKLSG